MDGSPAVVDSDVFDTYSPVINFSSLRSLIILAFGNRWEMRRWDILAFTNALPEEPTYVRYPKKMPDGFISCLNFKWGRLCLVTSKLYGSKTAPKLWCIQVFVSIWWLDIRVGGREEKGEWKERDRGGGVQRRLVGFGRGMAAGPPGSQTDQRLWLLLWLSSVVIKFSLIIGFDNSNLRDLFVMVCVMRIPACNGLRCNLVILTHTRRLVTQY